MHNEAQQHIIEEIAKMRTERCSYREISERLREEFDIRLSHEGVRKILLGDNKRHEEEVQDTKAKK